MSEQASISKGIATRYAAALFGLSEEQGDLETLSKWDISFTVKRKVLLAFALWDGDKKDMNANKMVSFWQILSLQ